MTKIRDFTRSYCGCPLMREDRSRFRKIYHAIMHNFFDDYIYYPLESLYNKAVERSTRSASWAKFMWTNYDFEAMFLYTVMAKKLRDVQKSLLKSSLYSEERQLPENMAALQATIEALDRLWEDDYETSRYIYKMPNEAFLKAMAEAEAERHADIDVLANALKHHLPTWWD